MALTPLYSVENCKFSYQLYWSLTIFWRSNPTRTDWLTELQQATERDGVRILKHRFGRKDCSHFLISTRPDVSPSRIPWSVKGRLLRLLSASDSFRRNYDLRSIGQTSGAKVEYYVAGQLRHHLAEIPRADIGVLQDLQFVNPDIDLSRPRKTSHGLLTCNLHLVFVHEDRCREIKPEVLLGVRDIIRRSTTAKGHLLSRIAILPDHIHLTLGTKADESPQDVALSYMNNIAYAHGMNPVLMHGCFLAGFGRYDLGAIRDE